MGALGWIVGVGAPVAAALLSSMGKKGSGSIPGAGAGAEGLPWEAILEVVATQEAGKVDFSAWNPNDAGRGVSWGFIQFNQGAGSIGRVLRLWADNDPATWQAWCEQWGIDGDYFLRVLTAANPSRNIDLRPYEQAFRAAGQIPIVQQAQRSDAWTSYAEPLIAKAQRSGLGSNTALAVVVDRSVNQGPGATGRGIELVNPGSLPDPLTAFIDLMASAAGGREARVRARVARVISTMQSLGFA